MNAIFGFRCLPGKRLTLGEQKCLSIQNIEVIKNSPAERGGLLKDDLILGVGEALLDRRSTQDDILFFFKRQPVGEKLNLKVRRGKEDLSAGPIPTSVPL